MTRMTRPDCAVIMCNLINTHTNIIHSIYNTYIMHACIEPIYIHTYTHRYRDNIYIYIDIHRYINTSIHRYTNR